MIKTIWDLVDNTHSNRPEGPGLAPVMRIQAYGRGLKPSRSALAARFVVTRGKTFESADALPLLLYY